uniref:Uncharacterized protein n=1 Tax=Tanacetum cinerariifolium TaxID=118510 RepID=A0A699I4Z5_TANCI|nr:hypothetical protein [Tanacetum cinerariifolium]
MSLEESDDLDILDAELVDPVLEASALPKFDMHLYTSSLTEINVKWLTKCYGIPVDLRPRVVLEGMSMNALPSDVIGLYAHHFQQGGLQVVISLRKPPLSLLYVAGLSNVWKHAGCVFPLKDSKGKVVIMVEFLRLPNFKSCKIVSGDLLAPGSAQMTHLSSSAKRLEDLPPNKEKKKRKAEEKAEANAPATNIQAERVVRNKDAGKEADEEYVSPNVSAGRMGVLRNQTDEHVIPLPAINAGGFMRDGEGVQENLDVAFFREGHGDNEGGLSGPLLDIVEMPERTKVVPKVETSYSVGRFGNLPFTPQWGMTDSSHMDNSHQYRDMMLSLFTPVDNGFFNEGVRNESAVKRTWKLLCQSAQQQANALLYFEALMEKHADFIYAHESCKDVKARYKECKKELAQI